jgi:hypothetical protein
MMVPIDMNRVHLWMGLTHPIFGPMNLAAYSAWLGYAWYVEWIRLLLETTNYGEKPRNPA